MVEHTDWDALSEESRRRFLTEPVVRPRPDRGTLMAERLSEAEREALAVALLAHEMRSWKAAPDPSELMSHDPANWRCVNAVDAAHAIAPAVEALLAARLAPIEALAELSEAATAGEWRAQRGDVLVDPPGTDAGPYEWLLMRKAWPNHMNARAATDAEFVAACVNAVRAALATPRPVPETERR